MTRFNIPKLKEYIVSGRGIGILSLVISSIFSFLPFMIFPISGELDKIFAVTSFSTFTLRIVTPVITSFYLSLFNEDKSNKAIGVVLFLGGLSAFFVWLITFFLLSILFSEIINFNDPNYITYVFLAGIITFVGILESFLYSFSLKNNKMFFFYSAESLSFILFLIGVLTFKNSLYPSQMLIINVSRSLFFLCVYLFSIRKLIAKDCLDFEYLPIFFKKTKLQFGLNAFVKMDVLFERFLATLVGEGYVSILAALRQLTSGVSVFLGRHLVDFKLTEMYKERHPGAYFLKRHKKLQYECFIFYFLGASVLFFILRYFQHSKINFYHLIGFYLSFGVVVAGSVGVILNSVFYISDDNLTPVKTGVQSFILSLFYRSFLAFYFSFWGLALSATIYYYYGYLLSLRKLKSIELNAQKEAKIQLG